MAWSYRKRIKIIPGVHLNFSKSGISTTIGIRGVSLNMGPSGTTLHTSLALPGIRNRHKLSRPGAGSLPQSPLAAIPEDDNIFSADIQEITSQDMQGIKEAILMANRQRQELQSDLLKTKAAAGGARLRLTASYLLLYGLIRKSIPRNIKADIRAQLEAIRQLRAQIHHCHVDLSIDFDPAIREQYHRLAEAFQRLSASQKIWDVTSAHFQDRVAARSSASIVVKKQEVRIGTKALPGIRSDFEALYFRNANGADLYFYPGFIVMYEGPEKFAIIGFRELNFYQGYVRFTEQGTVPGDSKVIDRTWFKVNRNGTPDKRFKDNFQIPVVRYGHIRLETATGLHEEYEFSNYEATEQFGTAFREYQATLGALRAL